VTKIVRKDALLQPAEPPICMQTQIEYVDSNALGTAFKDKGPGNLWLYWLNFFTEAVPGLAAILPFNTP